MLTNDGWKIVWTTLPYCLLFLGLCCNGFRRKRELVECVSVCMCVSACMCVCVSVWVCVREREIERERERAWERYMGKCHNEREKELQVSARHQYCHNLFSHDHLSSYYKVNRLIVVDDTVCFRYFFNAVLIRLVVQVKISLLLKIQWQEHDYLSEHWCGSVRELWSRDHDDA